MVQGAARSADLIGFIDRLAAEAIGRLTCGVLDNASIHTRAAAAARADAWLRKGLWLYGLPVHSPERDPLEARQTLLAALRRVAAGILARRG